MELPSNNFCFFCRSEVHTSASIYYSCAHIFCLKCYPILIFDLLSTKGINHEFFESLNTEYACPICGIGKGCFPYSDLFRVYPNNYSQSSNLICFACGIKEAETYFSDYQASFCGVCSNNLQNLGSQTKSQRFISLEQLKKGSIGKGIKDKERISSMESFRCGCQEKRVLSYFCLKCQVAICSICSEKSHKGHMDQFPIENVLFGVSSQFSNIEEKRDSLNDLFEDFREFEKNFLYQINHTLQNYNHEFNCRIDEIIGILQCAKMENTKKTLGEFQSLSLQMGLISSCFTSLKAEITANKEFMHPNKRFHIGKLLNNLGEKRLAFSDEIDIDFEESMKFVEKIKNRVTELAQSFEGKAFLKLSEKTGKIKIKDKTEASTDSATRNSNNPISMLKKPEKGISQKSCHYSFGKSNISCSFMIEDESFVAWAGYAENSLENENETYPLIVYNLTTMKEETHLQIDNKGTLSVVATYPKDETTFFGKKLLYCANAAGVLNVYEISKKFPLKSTLETHIGKEILSAIIFEDRFDEFSSFDASEKEDYPPLFLMVAFEAYSFPIWIYKTVRGTFWKNGPNSEIKWEVFREINNPVCSTCYTINYFHDADLQKTKFALGFYTSFIKIYDLESNEWAKVQFETSHGVTSINFLFHPGGKSSVLRSEACSKFIIYTQFFNTTMNVGNLEDGTIVRKIDLNNVVHINDCCIWNPESEQILLIVSTTHSNSVHIIDFENLKVLYSKEMDEFPHNLVKCKRKSKKSRNLKDCLVCLMSCGEDSRIVYFE